MKIGDGSAIRVEKWNHFWGKNGTNYLDDNHFIHGWRPEDEWGIISPPGRLFGLYFVLLLVIP